MRMPVAQLLQYLHTARSTACDRAVHEVLVIVGNAEAFRIALYRQFTVICKTIKVGDGVQDRIFTYRLDGVIGD